MRIRQITIQNFRGIQALEWAIPDKRTICLIGRGDSTKSTILEALRRVFHPHWSLGFDDSDFFDCSAKNRLKIDAVIGALPEEFHDLEVYAQRMSGWNTEALKLEEDPGDGLDPVLKVRLEVGDDLEPSWRVIKGDEDEGVVFRTSDRGKVGVALIGTASDRDLTWSRGSLLSRLTNGESIPSLLADAGRAARTSLEEQRESGLMKFDEVAATAEKAAKELGVRVNSKYAANLDSDGLNIRLGGLAIHDGAVPLRQLGLGSKRVLTTGLQRHALGKPHVTLVDEIEHGLEPHRLARLIDYIKSDEMGQYFVTTHSPVALREFDVKDLHVVHAKAGRTQVVAAAQPNFAASIQGKIRAHAEALLAPRMIVCEGATEVGFLRGWDAYWLASGKRPFAYQGIALVDANGGNKVRGVAEDLRRLSYDVAALADCDDPTQFNKKDIAALAGNGVPVTVWADDMCLEQRVFTDVPWTAVLASLALAIELKNEAAILSQVKAHYKGETWSSDYSTWTDVTAIRSACGTAAKDCDWFKSIAKGRQWALTICPHCGAPSFAQTDLAKKLAAMREWVDLA